MPHYVPEETPDLDFSRLRYPVSTRNQLKFINKLAGEYKVNKFPDLNIYEVRFCHECAGLFK